MIANGHSSDGATLIAPASSAGAPASAPPLADRFRIASASIGFAVAALGAVMLVGWGLGLERAMLPSTAPLMKANAALCFVLTGLALALRRGGRSAQAIASVFSALTVAIALATLAEWVLGIDLGIDELLFRDETRAYTTEPGRIAPNTALAFVLLGTSQLLLRSDGRGLQAARALALAALAIGAIALAGHLYDVSPLFAVARRTGMALAAAVGLVALSAGVLLARPERGPLALLTADGSGGALGRRLLPAAMAVPVLLAIPAQWGVTAGLLDQAYASALVTVGLTGVLAWLVLANVRSVQAGEAARLAREREVEQLNRQLAARALELSAVNRELEAFCYSVSHDLRSPLRSIDGFGLALLEDCAASLPPDGQEHVRRMRAASQRMGQLIDDLLQLSRVTRTELRRERVDLSAVAREIAAELARAEPGRRVTCDVEDGLVAEGDPGLLRVVFQNLLANAWKFTARRDAAHVAVGGTTRDGRPAFFVRDDGAGFDMAYAAKLFGAFQRLHGASEFPGTGIGLATVQRVVNRHGGEIWADGAVGRGATFTFTLPAPRRSTGEAA